MFKRQYPQKEIAPLNPLARSIKIGISVKEIPFFKYSNITTQERQWINDLTHAIQSGYSWDKYRYFLKEELFKRSVSDKLGELTKIFNTNTDDHK